MDAHETHEERARRHRREAYLKAKERSQAARLAAKNSPAALARKAELKAKRREVYLKAKAAARAKIQSQEEREKAERRQLRAQRDTEILNSLTRGTEIPPPSDTSTARLEDTGDTESTKITTGSRKLKLIHGGK